ncbi:MAG: DUF3667 domain-containing protein [Saprospiraceae bacterium]
MQPTEDQHQKICRNCAHILSPTAKYCSQCKQKYSTGRIAFSDLFHEFFTTIFNFDSKIFVTLRDLAFPGKLTQQYFRGKHQTYLHPLRLFLVTALVHFAIIGVYLGGEEGLKAEFSDDNFMQSAYYQDFVTNLDSNTIQLKQYYDNPTVNVAFDSLTYSLKKRFPFQDSLDLSFDISSGKGFNYGQNIKNRDLRVSYQDYTRLSPEALFNKYGVTNFWSRFLGKQFIKINKKGGSFGLFIFGKLTWMTLFMMPILALVLKLLYIRSNHYYIEHLIFSFHYHAFAFILVSLLILLAEYLPDVVIVIFAMSILFYLYKAMRKVYEQGRFKTIVKFCILNLSYLVLFILFIALTFVIGFFLF